MSLTSKKNLIERARRSKESRNKLVAKNLAQEIAFEIIATMNARGMTKADLARLTGMGANNLTRIMSPDYGKQSVSSLRRVSEALDVALVVRLVPFSQYIDWLSGTRHLDDGLSPQSLAVPSFQDEENAKAFEAKGKWTVYSNPSSEAKPVLEVKTESKPGMYTFPTPGIQEGGLKWRNL